jgi:hypothetical protein
VTKKYDRATTPHRRAEAHPKVADHDKALLADTYMGQTDTAQNGPREVAPCTTMVSRSLVQGVGRLPARPRKRALDLRGLGLLTCGRVYMYVCQLASPGIRGVSGA